MSSSKINPTGDCKERVAFDLMALIADVAKKEDDTKDRAYWFNLYSQCHELVIEGKKANEIL